MEICYNHVALRGSAAAEPVYSHETYGQTFYRFPLRVVRLSGQEDVIPVIVPAAADPAPLPALGQKLLVEGQLRSFNNKSGQGARLVLSVYSRILVPEEGPDANSIHLSGILCKAPVVRRTPLGRCICDLMLAVNRKYGRADYIPCIAWGQAALQAGKLDVGDSLELIGRIQSREYTKVIEGCTFTRTAYEVSIMEILP